jgi:hypothetical protein
LMVRKLESMRISTITPPNISASANMLHNKRKLGAA